LRRTAPRTSKATMNNRGFLGTTAPLYADLTLLLSIAVALTLTVGMVLAIRKRYDAHRWVQTVAVTLNILLVLGIMVGSFFRSAAPGLPERVGEPYFGAAATHALLGLVAFVFGTFVMLRGNKLVPQALRFKDYKLFMRTAYGLYMVATALGVWVYAAWYLAPAAAPVAAPQPAAQNELVVPMVNFVYNPREVTVPVGATVIWINQDAAPHTATSDDGALFDSDLIAGGQEYRRTFDTTGEFPYFCTLHGSAGGVDMAGVVRVVPEGEAPPLIAAAPEVAAPTPQPTSHPLPADPLGQPAGTAAFRDDQARSDRVVVDVALPAVADGQVLVAFLTSADGSVALPLGQLTPDGAGRARLEFSAPDGQNLAGVYSRIVVASEPAGSAPERPTGDLVLVGELPPVAFTHMVRLLADGPGLPVQQGYAVGMRLQTDELLRHARLVAASQAAGDLAGVRRHAEHVYNLVAGSRDSRFGDLDGDGRSQNPGDGFGLLENGDQAGYIGAVAEAVQAAAGSQDATRAITVHAGHVTLSAENMRGWATAARDLALRLTQAADAASAAADAAQLVALAQQVQRGLDANGDGEIAPVAGEGGGIVAYEHAQFMAGFGLFPPQP
jgi:plastocyanin